jgi:hypothetical protein
MVSEPHMSKMETYAWMATNLTLVRYEDLP